MWPSESFDSHMASHQALCVEVSGLEPPTSTLRTLIARTSANTQDVQWSPSLATERRRTRPNRSARGLLAGSARPCCERRSGRRGLAAPTPGRTDTGRALRRRPSSGVRALDRREGDGARQGAVRAAHRRDRAPGLPHLVPAGAARRIDHVVRRSDRTPGRARARLQHRRRAATCRAARSPPSSKRRCARSTACRPSVASGRAPTA